MIKHWLEIDGKEGFITQLTYIKEYLDENENARATIYECEEDILYRVVLLETNEDEDEIIDKLHLDKCAMKRVETKPENISEMLMGFEKHYDIIRRIS